MRYPWLAVAVGLLGCQQIVGFGDEVQLRQSEAGEGGSSGGNAATGGSGAGSGGASMGGGGGLAGASGAGGTAASGGVSGGAGSGGSGGTGAASGNGGTGGSGGSAATGGAGGSSGGTGGCPTVAPGIGPGGGLIYLMDAEQDGGCGAEIPPFPALVGSLPPDCDSNSASSQTQSIVFVGDRKLGCLGCLPGPEPELWVEVEVVSRAPGGTAFLPPQNGLGLFSPVAEDEDDRTGAEVVLLGDRSVALRCPDGTESASLPLGPTSDFSLRYTYSWLTHSGSVYLRLLNGGFPSGQVDKPGGITLACPCGPAPTGFIAWSDSDNGDERASVDDYRITRSESELDAAITMGN